MLSLTLQIYVSTSRVQARVYRESSYCCNAGQSLEKEQVPFYPDASLTLPLDCRTVASIKYSRRVKRLTADFQGRT